MTKQETILDKMQKIDRRILYWVLFIGLMIPFVSPLGLPVAVTPSTVDLYKELTKVKTGEVIIINLAFGVSAWSECLPATVASTKLLFKQGAKIIFLGVHYDVDLTWAKIKDQVPAFKTLTYGKNYVYLGFYTGGEATVARLATSIRTVFPTDADKKSLDEIEMMKNVNVAKDIKLVLSSDTGDWCDYYIRQWRVPYGTPVGEIGIAMLGSSYMPHYQAGILFGMTVGVRGGAELEKLIGELGEATVTMDSINISHVMAIVAIGLANLGYAATVKRGGK